MVQRARCIATGPPVTNRGRARRGGIDPRRFAAETFSYPSSGLRKPEYEVSQTSSRPALEAGCRLRRCARLEEMGQPGTPGIPINSPVTACDPGSPPLRMRQGGGPCAPKPPPRGIRHAVHRWPTESRAGSSRWAVHVDEPLISHRRAVRGASPDVQSDLRPGEAVRHRNSTRARRSQWQNMCTECQIPVFVKSQILER